MGDWPFLQTISKIEADTSGDYGHAFPSGGSAHTKGAYVTLIAATEHDACGIIITNSYAEYQNEFLADIAIGSAGNEEIIIPNLHYSKVAVASRNLCDSVFFPIAIPANSRISARCQSTQPGDSLYLCTHVIYGPLSQGYSKAIAYGAVTGDSGGTMVDPGTTASTKGSYSEITPITLTDTQGVVLAIGGRGDTAREFNGWRMDLAIGNASSEKVIWPDIHFTSDTNTNAICPGKTQFMPLKIPVNTRLSARAQCAITTTNRYFDVIVYALI